MTRDSTTPTRRPHPSTRSAIPGHKRCSQCNLDLPANTQSFYADPRKLDGLRAVCRRCQAEIEAQKYAVKKASKPKWVKITPGTLAADSGVRACAHCNQVKPLDPANFHRAKLSYLGFGYVCRGCSNLRSRKRYDADPNREEKWKANNSRVTKKLKVQACLQEYLRCESCDKTLPRNAEHFPPNGNWRAEFQPICWDCQRAAALAEIEKLDAATDLNFNQAIIAAKTMRRFRTLRSRRKRKIRQAVAGPIPRSYLQALWVADQACYYCARTMTLSRSKRDPLHRTMDHIIPLARGGDNQKSNLVYACRSCNSSKHDAMPWSWLGVMFCDWLQSGMGKGKRLSSTRISA